jgi:sulfatase maturation enzyme AslB (radical SAM superfamily)
METETTFNGDYGPRRLNVELANICNLHCSYCFRADENLYSSHAEFFSIPLLRRVIAEARAAANITRVSFTGGEPTLHPAFAETLQTIGDAGLTTSFVTNGWHFDRVWPAIQENRAAVSHVAFSLDGVTREDHDRWRGNGSFDRLVRAFFALLHVRLAFRDEDRDSSRTRGPTRTDRSFRGANGRCFVALRTRNADVKCICE